MIEKKPDIPVFSSIPKKNHLDVFTMNQSSAARPMMDLTIDNITENVHAINSRCPDPRLRYLVERLVVHLHDFTRETRLSTGEWMAALEFLTDVGQTCTSVRQVSFFSLTQKECAYPLYVSDGL